MRSHTLAVVGMAIALMVTAGCGGDAVSTDNSGTTTTTTHVHRHGPVLNGEMFEFDSDYSAEAKNVKGENIIRIAILDAAGKKLARVPVESISVKRVSGTDGATFTLTPSPDDVPTDEGAYLFELNDADFALAWSLGIEVEMKIGDKVYKGTLPAFEPH